jgi:ribosomal protein S18 acetylase RimI-like enzyme
MVETIKVERLESSDKPELLDLFTQAFTEHPLIPAVGAKPEATRPVMKAFIDFFGGTRNSLLYGIRKDNKLACASVSLDSTVAPSKSALIGFIFSLSQAVGWRIVRELEVVVREEPKYEDRYLELVVFGTLPAYQRQGLGRKMLNFLYNEAKREGV